MTKNAKIAVGVMVALVVAIVAVVVAISLKKKDENGGTGNNGTNGGTGTGTGTGKISFPLRRKAGKQNGVLELQQMLNKMGRYSGDPSFSPLVEDGIFGEKTEKMVEEVLCGKEVSADEFKFLQESTASM